MKLTNVSRLVMRPIGHSGKAKKGHLVFDASFESGNLGRVDRISHLTYDLFVRPDIADPRHRLWFNFTIDNAINNQRIIINIVNLAKSCHIFHSGFGPVVRSSQYPQWCAIQPEYVFYYRSPEHRMRYVLSFAFVFNGKDNDVYQFALSYPYTYSKHCHQLQHWKHIYYNKPNVGLTQNFRFEINTIGKSLQNRDIHLITIGGNKCLEDSKIGSKIVIITARLHPSETATSYICEGIINLLISDDPVATCLRSYTKFYIIPMPNPDGVFVGNTRTSVIGSDLNASWHKISPLMHPELVAVKQTIEDIAKTYGEDVDTYIDLHAHTYLLGACIYGVSRDDIFHMERHALFPKLLSIIADDFYIDNTVYCKERHSSGSSRSYMTTIFHSKTNCYTLEVSHYGYYDKQTLGHTIIPYTDKKYKLLAENMVIALLDCYRTIGHIPPNDISPQIQHLLSHTSQGMLSQSNEYKLKDSIIKLTTKSINS
ncbi:cytosolic carboxypeptidase 6-like [Oppia nitens]|uniref:cytosolic carboxypeptidase 6-like n=1 Tax=Oppia nitens TaxID=1686743 RepID=UPI0023DC8099|nr:cytosolic carboxypeptidase 6-like [Oppia nitens]